MADGGYPNKIKRPCLEDVTLSMGPGAHPSMTCAELQVPPLTIHPSPTTMGASGHSLLLENNPMNNNAMGLTFAAPPTAELGMKQPAAPYYDKANSTLPVDQELQDLLEELAKIQDISENELDLEKILGSKPVQPLALDTSQATLGTTRKPAPQMQQLERIGSSKDFASGCSQVTGMSLLQIPSSSTGMNYSMPSTSKPMVSNNSATTQSKSQVQVMQPVTLPPLPGPQWHHAHQLKVLAASKQGSATQQPLPTPGWSTLPPPILPPPYCPVPSLYPPLLPFNPQNLMVSCMSSSNLQGGAPQSAPNALLSSTASSSSAGLGPTMVYAPEKLPGPTVNQQPQFSSQSSILSNVVPSTIKPPQGHLVPALSTSNLGPSAPYRPEKLSSPGLPQQSFTPQSSLICSGPRNSNPLSQQQKQKQKQQQQTNVTFKPRANNAPKPLNVIMQQGLAGPNPGALEPFTFGNTKPLSHFTSEPGPQRMPSMSVPPQQPSLLYYLQQPMPNQASSATASSMAMATLQLQQQQQPACPPFFLQQMMQQPQCFPRRMASEAIPPLPRQQKKQRSGLIAVTPDQQSAFITQQMSQFQAVQEQTTSNCSWTKASTPSNHRIMPPRTGFLPNSLSPGMSPPRRHQSYESMISSTPGKQQRIFNPNPAFPTPLHSGQNLLGSLGSVCWHTQMPKAAPSGVPLPRFCPHPLGSQHLSPHQLRQPCMPRMPNMYSDAIQVATAAIAATPVVSREPSPSQGDTSSQQHFASNSIFTKAPMRLPLVAPACPSQQTVMPPSPGAPGGRPGQKVSAALASPSSSQRQSPVRGPVPVLNVTKSPQQGIASFGHMSPIQGIEPPPSDVAATATATDASAIAANQYPGPLNRMDTSPKLPPYNVLPQPQPPLKDRISPPDCSEMDFIEAFLKSSIVSPVEDWECNLRLIDDILQQQLSAAQNAAAKNAGQVTQNNTPTRTHVDITLGSGVNP